MTQQEDLYALFDLKEYLMHQIYCHAEEISSYSQIQIQQITYNVGEKKPSAKFQAAVEPNMGIYVICLQEIDMSTAAIMTSNSKNTQLWLDFIKQKLGSKYSFDYKQMGAILLIVAIDLLLKEVKLEGFQTVARGFAKAFGNKGGVAAIVKAMDSRYLFIGMHLSSDRSINGVKKRNNDILAIVQGCFHVPGTSQFYKLVQDIAPHNQLLIYDKILDEAELGKLKDNPDAYVAQQEFVEFDIPNIFRHVDFIFLLGDMNFRVNNELDMKIIAERLLKEQDYRKEVYEKDQLTKQFRFFDSPFQIFPYDDLLQLKFDKEKSIKNTTSISQVSAQVCSKEKEGSTVESDIGELSVITSKKRATKRQSPYNSKEQTAKLPPSSIGKTQQPASNLSTSDHKSSKQQPGSTNCEESQVEHEDSDDESASAYEGFQTEYALGLLYGFKEAQVQFLPTYKYALVEEFDEFAVDVTKGHKARAPAYCDRVIFKVNCRDGLDRFRINYYQSVQDCRTSDHRPVLFNITLPVRKVVQERITQFNHDVVKKSEFIQQQLKPSFSLAHQQVKVKNVRYAMSQVVKIEVENNHQISPCTVQVLKYTVPPFIIVSQQEFVILPKQRFFVKFDIRLQHIWSKSQDIGGFFEDFYKTKDGTEDLQVLKRRFLNDLRNLKEISFRIKFQSRDVNLPCTQELFMTLYINHDNFPSLSLEEHCLMQQRIYFKKLEFANNFKVIIIPMELLLILDYFERVLKTAVKPLSVADAAAVMIFQQQQSQVQQIFHMICQQRDNFTIENQRHLNYLILKNIVAEMFKQISQIQQTQMRTLVQDIIKRSDEDESLQDKDFCGIPQLLLQIMTELIDSERPMFSVISQLKYDDEFYCLTKAMAEVKHVTQVLGELMLIPEEDNPNLQYLKILVTLTNLMQTWIGLKRQDIFCFEIQQLETNLTKSINECTMALQKMCYIPVHISPVVVMLQLLNFLSAYQDSICPPQFYNFLSEQLKSFNPKQNNFQKLLKLISENINQTSRAILISLVSLIRKVINHPILGPQLDNEAFRIRLAKVFANMFFHITNESLNNFVNQLLIMSLQDLIALKTL